MDDLCGFEVLEDGPPVSHGTLPALAMRNGVRYCRLTTVGPAEPENQEAHEEAHVAAMRTAQTRGDQMSVWGVIPCANLEEFTRLAAAGPVGVILVPSPYFIEQCFEADQFHCQLAPTKDEPGVFDCESLAAPTRTRMATYVREACDKARSHHDPNAPSTPDDPTPPQAHLELTARMRELSIELGMSPEEYDAHRERLSARRDDADFQIFFPGDAPPPES